jgi:LIVCS family branched-chain amino acid:cation transporter
MKHEKTSQIISVGIAIFAMLFGAGNVVFPLGLGRDVGSQIMFAVAGLSITAIIVPILGLISVLLFDGDYKKFLGMTGRISGSFIAFVCMILIGPFGAIPRCITLSYAAIKWHFTNLPLFVFSLVISCLIFAATFKRSYVIELFGKVLGPLKLTLLLSVIVLGFFSTATSVESSFTPISSFFRGLQEGYWTLDLLGMIFFSGLIMASIKSKYKNNLDPKQIVMFGI